MTLSNWKRLVRTCQYITDNIILIQCTVFMYCRESQLTHLKEQHLCEGLLQHLPVTTLEANLLVDLKREGVRCVPVVSAWQPLDSIQEKVHLYITFIHVHVYGYQLCPFEAHLTLLLIV